MDFITRVLISRRVQHARWSASLAAPPPAPPAGVPVSAWATPQRVRRRRNTTERVLVEVTPIHWQYIAPTVAAIIPAPRARFTWFERKIQLPLRLEVYPPPTGPPNPFPAFELSGHHRRRETSRELRIAESPPFFQTTPAVFPSFEPSGHHRRHETTRTLRISQYPPVYPKTPVQAPLPAVYDERVKHKPSTNRRLARIDFAPVYPPSPVGNAQSFPSWLPTGFHRRSETSRKLLKVAPQHGVAVLLYPAWLEPKTNRRHDAPRRLLHVELNTYPQSPYSAWATKDSHRRHDSERRLLRTELVISQQPVVQNTYPAWATRDVERRRETSRHLLRVELVSVAAQPVAPNLYPAWKLAEANIRHERGKRLVPPDPQLTHPPTPPVAEQPLDAWKMPVAFRTSFRRRLLPADPQLVFPTSYTIDGEAVVTLAGYESITVYNDGEGRYFVISRVDY